MAKKTFEAGFFGQVYRWLLGSLLDSLLGSLLDSLLGSLLGREIYLIWKNIKLIYIYIYIFSNHRWVCIYGSWPPKQAPNGQVEQCEFMMKDIKQTIAKLIQANISSHIVVRGMPRRGSTCELGYWPSSLAFEQYVFFLFFVC